VLAITPAIAVTGLTGAAFATAPDTWEDPGQVGVLNALVVFVFIPLGLFMLITLLVMLPFMRKGESYQPGQVWRSEPEWFGGPRGGIDAVDETPPAAVGSGRSGSAADRGGASGHW
jgi:hypothetical protein